MLVPEFFQYEINTEGMKKVSLILIILRQIKKIFSFFSLIHFKITTSMGLNELVGL